MNVNECEITESILGSHSEESS